MGRIRRRAGAGRGVVVLAFVLICSLCGCTYSKDEPGLFGRAAEPTTAAPPTSTQRATASAPAQINPDLPVVDEATWTSADGYDIQVRIAVHAVRRISGGTVLDWSVTPLRGPGLHTGDVAPEPLNLGLFRFGEGNANVFLIDAYHRLAYRPLTVKGASGLQHCLCSPIWVAQRHLRIGETRLLQIAYPELPADVVTVDVDIATVAPFWHVPVSAEGQLPLATSPTNLARPPAGPTVGTSTPTFRYQPSAQRFVLSIDRIVASSTFTSVEWTIQSLTPGDGVESAARPPLAEPEPDAIKNYNPTSATGPRLLPLGRSGTSAIRVRMMTTKLRGLGGLECLCSDFRAWAKSLQSAGQQASVVTNFPPLPQRMQRVDVLFPGLTTLRGVQLTQASDGSIRSAGPVPDRARTWTYDQSDPPSGWTVDQWPTPLPRSSQLNSYQATVDVLVR